MHEELKELVTKLYKETGLDVEPTYPRVLIRLLPKEQISKGGIVLTDHQQNKPTHEGIVVATYKPFMKTITKTSRENWERRRASNLIEVYDGENLDSEHVWMKAPVEVGDHVLFPHMDYGITPVWPLDDGKGDYRLVPDDQILGLVEYHKERTKDWLLNFLKESEGQKKDEVVENLLSKASVIRADFPSATLSGR